MSPSRLLRWNSRPRPAPGGVQASTLSSCTCVRTRPCCRARARSRSTPSCRPTSGWVQFCTRSRASHRAIWARSSTECAGCRARSSAAATSSWARAPKASVPCSALTSWTGSRSRLRPGAGAGTRMATPPSRSSSHPHRTSMTSCPHWSPTRSNGTSSTDPCRTSIWPTSPPARPPEPVRMTGSGSTKHGARRSMPPSRRSSRTSVTSVCA